MKLIKKALELYINSSVHVAVAVVAFTLVTILNHDLVFEKDLVIFIFLASITGYNFVKYAGIAKLHHSSLAKNLKIIQVFSLVCFLGMLFYLFRLKMETVIALVILGGLTLLYALPLFTQKRNLRSLPGIKIFIIAVVWAGVTVILPYIEYERLLDWSILIDFLQRLILVIVLTLPFELRDLRFDSEELETIPQRLGVFQAKVFGSILLLLLFGIEFFQINDYGLNFLLYTIVLLVTAALLWISGTRQPKYYSSFIVEGVPIFYFLLVYFIR